MNAAVGGAILALAAAGCFAVANTLQHHGANQSAGGSGRGLLRQLLARPAWLGGIAFDLLGMAVHALALSTGALSVVQPLMVSGLLFALPVNRLVTGRRIGAAEYAWSTLAVSGLAVFLLSAHPTGGQEQASGTALAIGITAAAGLIAVAVLAARRPGRRHRAALLGLAAGTAFGVVAALTKQVTTAAPLGIPALITSWPLYGLLAAGAAGVLLSQAAYRAGPLTGSLPVITITDPVVAIALGVIGFGESLAGSPLRFVLATSGFTAMTVAAVALARHSGLASPVTETGPTAPVRARTADLPPTGAAGTQGSRHGESAAVPDRSPAPVGTVLHGALCPSGAG